MGLRGGAAPNGTHFGPPPRDTSGPARVNPHSLFTPPPTSSAQPLRGAAPVAASGSRAPRLVSCPDALPTLPARDALHRAARCRLARPAARRRAPRPTPRLLACVRSPCSPALTRPARVAPVAARGPRRPAAARGGAGMDARRPAGRRVPAPLIGRGLRPRGPRWRGRAPGLRARAARARAGPAAPRRRAPSPRRASASGSRTGTVAPPSGSGRCGPQAAPGTGTRSRTCHTTVRGGAAPPACCNLRVPRRAPCGRARGARPLAGPERRPRRRPRRPPRRCPGRRPHHGSATAPRPTPRRGPARGLLLPCAPSHSMAAATLYN